MKKTSCFFKVALVISCLLVTLGTSAEEFKDMLLVVMAGQSNMAGRGIISEEDQVPIPNVYMLTRKGEWVPAIDPVHFDHKRAGVGMGRTFAKLLSEKYPGKKIGLVPCAVGGSSISQWKRDGKKGKAHPYQDAMERIKIAQKSGKIVVVLWHQGCSDSWVEKPTENYKEKLLELIRRFRNDVPELQNVPFIMGELSIAKSSKRDPSNVNACLHEIAGVEPLTGLVKGDGLTLNRDKVHYDAQSQKILGKRYFDEFEKLTPNK